MRRSEFQIEDPAAITSFLNECEYGVISLISDGKPYGVTVNFAYKEGKIYFHGALEGRKAEAIEADAGCSFTAVKPYAYIPSYFSDTRSACPATQFFASVIAEGHVIRLDAIEQKMFGLTALMEKMQPEGGYEPIDAANPIYTKMLEQTGVYAIENDRITFKIKAGQNLSKEQHNALTKHMQARDTASDHETLALMQSLQNKESL
ncbi:MAG: pyridoxamine 5'-phosphate oxidase family protein [Campylobacterales bacterium]|mgnify:CR=1 FL=1|nr:pyridoxamine 5'-phosphate oxidase family protein [Campylobacterales bacterium]HEO97688.1 antibiotic resistance protein [Campylobacterota bacterium]